MLQRFAAAHKGFALAAVPAREKIEHPANPGPFSAALFAAAHPQEAPRTYLEHVP